MSKNQSSDNRVSHPPSPAVDSAASAPGPALPGGPPAATLASPPPFTPVPGESERAFEAFRVYLELGPRRRLLTAARQVGVTLRTIQRWAGEFDWRGRLQAHTASAADLFARSENALQHEQLQNTAARAKNFYDRQYALADAILDLAERYLERLEVADLDQLRLTDACRALDFASRVVRQTRESEAAAAPDNGLRDQITTLLDQAYRESATAARAEALRQSPPPGPATGNQPA